MASVTAASFPLTLGGKTYDMSPLDDEDIEAISNWMRSSMIEDATRAARGMPDADQERVIGIAIRQARQVSFLSPDGMKLLRSVDGVARVMWQGIKRNHPEVKVEDIRSAFLVNPADLKKTNAVWEELNLGKREEQAAGGTANPKGRRRRRAKK